MLEELSQNQHLFCEKPVDEQRSEEAAAKWNALVRTESAGNAVRFAQEPHQQFAALKAFYVSSAGKLFDLVSKDLPRFKSVIDLLQRAFADLLSTVTDIQVSASRKVVLTQIFEGIVTSITDKHVMIEFKIDDDLDVRQFSWDDVDGFYRLALEEGRPVRARCELELIPPREPMSEDERKKWEEEHRGTRGYLKKAKPGRNLLEEDDE